MALYHPRIFLKRSSVHGKYRYSWLRQSRNGKFDGKSEQSYASPKGALGNAEARLTDYSQHEIIDTATQNRTHERLFPKGTAL